MVSNPQGEAIQQAGYRILMTKTLFTCLNELKNRLTCVFGFCYAGSLSDGAIPARRERSERCSIDNRIHFAKRDEFLSRIF